MPSARLTSRNVLVAVSGRTPAVITETLWALERRQGISIDEIRAITTTEGRRCIVEQLLGPGGAFTAYCVDYGIPAGRISFSERNIYVLTRPDGTELEDIRTSEDNESAADQVYRLIREWTERTGETLFCSAAGGRKTLGIYLGMSLMLCGRPADSLSHVLVSQEFESGVKGFYYPPPEPRFYERIAVHGSQEGTSTVCSDAADVELADIPFPRLRELIGGDFPVEKGFTDAVSHSQLLLNYLQAPPPLVVRLDAGSADFGRFSIHMSRQVLAVYCFLLFESESCTGGVSVEDLFERRSVIAELERYMDRFRQGEKESYAWEKMTDLEDFKARIGPCISKANAAVRKALGRNRLAERYTVSTRSRRTVDAGAFRIVMSDGKPWPRQR